MVMMIGKLQLQNQLILILKNIYGMKQHIKQIIYKVGMKLDNGK